MTASAQARHRIALISDIHGNEIALRAVLAELAHDGVEQIACLGDVATLGPRPRQVLELLRERCAWFILGNHDEYMFAPSLIEAHTSEPTVVGAVHWCRDELRADDLRFVQGFERRRPLSLGASGELLLFHGTPDSNNHDLLAETPDAALAQALGEQRCAALAGGHTHLQLLRQHRGRLLVNPGSVGMPFERYVHGGPPTILPFAEYAVVEASARNLSVSLRRVALDPAELLQAARAWDAPLAPYLVAQYERCVASGA